MEEFNKISYLEEELQELEYLELRAKPLNGKWVPYNLFNGILHTKINITQINNRFIEEVL